MHTSRGYHALLTWLVMQCSRSYHVLVTWLIMLRSRKWSCTVQLTDHVLITWLLMHRSSLPPRRHQATQVLIQHFCFEWLLPTQIFGRECDIAWLLSKYFDKCAACMSVITKENRKSFGYCSHRCGVKWEKKAVKRVKSIINVIVVEDDLI